MTYDFNQIEAKWQAHWAEHGTFRTPNPDEQPNGRLDAANPKFYVLDMFPYPSGVGLHVGHPLGYIATDIVARYQRMRGFNVLHPMGFDAFGLPAEQFAIEHGVHPRETTQKNIDNMVRQLQRLGLGYDWDRSLATTDVDYYGWTQWIFLQLFHSYFDPLDAKAKPIDDLRQMLLAEQYYLAPDGGLIHAGALEDLGPIAGDPIGVRKWSELDEEQQRAVLDEHRLAYLAEVPVNWCPALGTVLANEEVTADGRSERGNHPVFKRPLRQWMLRITAYADRLAADLEQVDWPEPIKLMQRNWIGRSRGAEVTFPLAHGTAAGDEDSLTVFTTRPDTLFGATYMVLAPEHPLVDAVTTAEQYHAVNAYRNEAARKSDIDRQAESKTKSGVFTGAYALNPVNNDSIPIWIADYVLTGYGTGAIMAVPAHDERDFDFARQFDLPIVPVVQPSDAWLKEHAPPELPPKSPREVAQADATQVREWYERNPASFGEAYTGAGPAIHSANQEVSLDGQQTPEAKRRMIEWLEDRGLGRGTVQYKLRDWLFSRQRYWGEPFPILHELDERGERTGRIRAVPEDRLPVELPPMEDFRPQASEDPEASVQTPLSRAPESWRRVELDGRTYERELNTMPQWAGSCWYYLRYLDPDNKARFVGRDAEQYWMTPSRAGSGRPPKGKEPGESAESPLRQAPAGGVDLYVGGAEHAVLHLLYARFWHKVLYDLGHVSTPEPFGRLYNQGYIQAYAYTDARGVYVPAAEVEERDGRFFYQGQEVKREFGKMGKSLKNAIAPDEVADEYGTDTLRLYEMYMGPLDQSKIWNTRDIVGVHRFLQRLWRNLIDDDTDALLVTDEQAPDALRRKLHKTIRRVTGAMESMQFNVAIAALIELNNELVPLPRVPRDVAEPMVRMLAPLAPHICEEFWQRLGHEAPGASVADADWPEYDPALLVEDQVEYPVQVNGKLRGKITVPADADQTAIEAAAKEDPKVAQAIEGKTIRKVIVVPRRLVNLVAK